eukprot:2746304-Rhodomonas_salina.1
MALHLGYEMSGTDVAISYGRMPALCDRTCYQMWAEHLDDIREVLKRVLGYAIGLRACYAMSGTERAYGAV